MIEYKNKYALITGASSGIGYELSKLLARDGLNLVMVARNINRLEETKKEIKSKYPVKIKVLPKDISNPEAPLEIFSEIEKENLNVEILINNAGFTLLGKFSETDLQKELEMIQVHITSLTSLTKLFLRKMLEKGEGKILNVASMAAFQPGPLHSIYSATKAYILHFSEALANELEGSGVSITCLCPGRTETQLFKRANIKLSTKASRDMMSADTVSKIGYRALKRGKVIIVPGLKNKLLTFFVRIAPRNIVTKIARSMLEKEIRG